MKKVWKSVGNNFIKNSFFQKPLMAWIEENLLDEVQTLKGMEWSLIFLTACYLAWFNRNLAVLENNTNAHTYLDCMIWNLARNYDQNLQLVQIAKANIPAVKHIQVFWKTPLPQKKIWLKLNVDGSLIGNSLEASYGGIMRDHEGTFILV